MTLTTIHSAGVGVVSPDEDPDMGVALRFIRCIRDRPDKTIYDAEYKDITPNDGSPWKKNTNPKD